MHVHGNTPNQVRAVDVVIDEGRIFALPGDLGEVLDSGELADGGRWVVVSFPAAPGATTCILGAEVQPLLAVVDPASELPAEPARAPAHVQAVRPAWRPRRAFAVGIFASMAALAAVLVWHARPTTEAPRVAARPAPGAVQDVGLTDIAPTWAPSFLAMGGATVPAKPEPSQKRPPCGRDLGEVAIHGACYAVLDTRPPCGRLYQWGDKCVRPILASQRPDTSIRER